MSKSYSEVAVPHEQEGTLKLREHIGHRWWGFVLSMNFFLAPLAALALSRVKFADSVPLSYLFWVFTLLVCFFALWFVSFVFKRNERRRRFWGLSLALTLAAAPICAFFIQRSTAPPELSTLFWFLTLTGSFTIAIFFLFVREYAPTAYELKIGHETRNLGEEEWRLIHWLMRAKALLHGVIRLEFFGWVIWVTAAITAIAGALRNAPLTDKTFDELDFLQKYFRTLDFAAYDLIRATVIGTIVLFFVQLLKTYQNAIIAAEEAARNAGTAAKDAETAIKAAQSILPTLNKQVQRTIEIFQAISPIAGVDILASKIAENLNAIGSSSAALGQVKELSERLFEYLKRINQEINSSYGAGAQASQFDMVSLSAIYTTYLKVESLSFEGTDSGTGQSGIRLSTRFPHYALAVHSVVEAIYRLDPTRYRFYTVFNREPEQFFNPERLDTPQASVDWTVLFLERFCRWQHRDNIPYTRHFVTYRQMRGTSSRDERGARQNGPPQHGLVDEQLEGNFILCNIRDGQKRPCLWGEAAWDVVEGGDASEARSVWSYLSEPELGELKEAVRQVVPSLEVRAALASLDMLKDVATPSYIIVSRDRKAKFDSVIKQHENELVFVTLKEALLEYHSHAAPPQKLVFERYADYEQFFGKTMPRDILAVWDTLEQCWCLCIGAMVGESDPNAVVMFVTSKERRLKHLPWDTLTAKLSALFCVDAASQECREITREPIA